MRITVTVVVIMFELTGALTYILPTMVKTSYYVYYTLFTVNIRLSSLQQKLSVTFWALVGSLMK
jgi:H+/Cl- antiporter ClcA